MRTMREIEMTVEDILEDCDWTLPCNRTVPFEDTDDTLLAYFRVTGEEEGDSRRVQVVIFGPGDDQVQVRTYRVGRRPTDVSPASFGIVSGSIFGNSPDNAMSPTNLERTVG